jgi:Xaa-Pro aminopeptidase
MRLILSLFAALLPAAWLPAAAAAPLHVLSQRDQAALQRGWLDKRFEQVLPGLMRRAGIDMWILVSREYAEDPVFRSMVPLTVFSSRRRTILVFTDLGPERGVERRSIGRFDYEGVFPVERTPDESQWEGLRNLVERHDPKSIGANLSELYSHADGITANEYGNLLRALGPKYAPRLKSAEALAVSWLQFKLPEETEGYRNAVRIAHTIISEAFSRSAVVPGVTTNTDLIWWMRQRIADAGLQTWFHPSVTIWRKGDSSGQWSGATRTIERGDMLHCDFGIHYLGFATDTQRNAYVLRPGETGAPADLRKGLKAANRLQDITMNSARAGISGNEALAKALAQAQAEGLAPSIYCHPIGYHGHGAGAPIGMFDNQNGVPGKGNHLLPAESWHAIELNLTCAVPSWGGQIVMFALEDDAVLHESGWEWVDGRQTEFYLIQ